MFAHDRTVKAEYLYIDLGKRSVGGATIPGAGPLGIFAAGSDFREHIARIGVNYRFGGSPFLGTY
jgi:opacity protein-like surface antigen